jgi:hypothetical protein
MKSQRLNEELIRIQEMMGVSPKLIMEAGPVNPIIEKGAKQLWKTLEELFSGTIERGTEKSLEETLEQLERVVGKENVEALKLISKGTENVATKNAKIIDFLANNPVIKQNIERVLEADRMYADALDKSIEQFLKDPEVKNTLNDLYVSALERTEGDVKNANKMMKQYLIPDFSEKELNKYFDSVKIIKSADGKFRIEPKVEPPKPNIDDDVLSDPNIEEMSNDALEDLKRLYEENKGTPKENINTTYFPAFMRFYYKYWKYMFTSTENLLGTTIDGKVFPGLIDKKMREIEVKLKANEVIDVDMEDLYMMILGLRKKRTVSVNNILYDKILNDPKLNTEFKKLLQTNAFKSSVDALLQSEAKNTYGPVEEQVRAWAQSLPVTNFIESIYSKEKFKITDLWKLLLPEPKRIANLIVWKDPRGFAEVNRHLTQYGKKRAIVSKIAVWLTMSHGLIPYLIADLKLIQANYKYNKSKVNYAIADELCKILKELNRPCTGLPTISAKPTREDFWKWFKGSMPFDYFGVSPYGDQDLVKNALFWTYLDEIGQLVYSGLYEAEFGEWDDGNFNRLFSVLEGKTQESLKELGWDESKSNEENLRNLKERMKKEGEEVIDPLVAEKELDAFFVFLQTKYPGVGMNDKPYMKKDPNTLNTFTFEKCVNEDCSKTKIETYTFNLTSGFKQKI